MEHRVGTVISYCTNDFRFLDMCIEEARCFSSQIIVVVADHFFNGEPENRLLLEKSYQKHPDCLFVEFVYSEKEPYGFYCPVGPSDSDWAHYWHSTSRYIGFHFLEEMIETVLFADVDEVHDGKRFLEWLDGFDYRSYEVFRLAGYAYFRSARYRSLSWHPISLFARKEALFPEILLDLQERQGIFEGIAGKKMKQAVGLDGRPLVHHFSWVRTREEMLFKTKSWGHRRDENWEALIEKEFSSSFRGVDSFYGLHYEEVEPWRDPFESDPFLLQPLLEIKSLPNVVRIDPKSFFRFTILKKKP
ncbi:MAG: hypothetical protein V4494_03215 [Chlamydiota bacterium]